MAHMRALTFTFEQSTYYSLELHAGAVSFDVHRGYLIDLLRQHAAGRGFNLKDSDDSASRPFTAQVSSQPGEIKVQLNLEDDEYAFAEAIGKRLVKAESDTPWPDAFIRWLIDQEGLELWGSIPEGTLVEDDVTYVLNPDLCCFYASSIKSEVAGGEMALPPAPYRFRQDP